MKVYAGVGSRETPPEILLMMSRISRKLTYQGWGLRSGGADGADNAFLEGALQANNVKETPIEIYLPWEDYNGKGNEWYCVDVSKLPNHHDAFDIASHFHPVWNRLKEPVKALHTRNVYQILGRDLKTYSSRLICWAKPIKDGERVRGGTATAVAMARHFGIPVMNLYFEEEQKKALKFINGD